MQRYLPASGGRRLLAGNLTVVAEHADAWSSSSYGSTAVSGGGLYSHLGLCNPMFGHNRPWALLVRCVQAFTFLLCLFHINFYFCIFNLKPI